jgi:two-component system, OmpR family, response regulator
MKPLAKILYVEDEPDIRTIAELALVNIGGFSVQVCASGHEALAAAPAFQPDLILLDIMMPDMDGPTTLIHLRQLPVTTTTPVIFMTAKVQAREIIDYLALDAIGVIPKPFDAMQLSAEVRALWEASS